MTESLVDDLDCDGSPCLGATTAVRRRHWLAFGGMEATFAGRHDSDRSPMPVAWLLQLRYPVVSGSIQLLPHRMSLLAVWSAWCGNCSPLVLRVCGLRGILREGSARLYVDAGNGDALGAMSLLGGIVMLSLPTGFFQLKNHALTAPVGAVPLLEGYVVENPPS